jgi:hypothetical protein
MPTGILQKVSIGARMNKSPLLSVRSCGDWQALS